MFPTIYWQVLIFAVYISMYNAGDIELQCPLCLQHKHSGPQTWQWARGETDSVEDPVPQSKAHTIYSLTKTIHF